MTHPMIPHSVLLVDDEVDFVDALARRIGKRDIQVQKAYSGQEALEKLGKRDSSRIDVVILDVKMPGMDGVETLARIKAEHPLVEVIMLTGHATVDNAVEGMKRGATDYLVKPCEIEVLMQKVEEAVRKKRDHEARILEAKVQAYALKDGID